MRNFFIVLIIASLSEYALANMRAAKWCPEGPSSFINQASSSAQTKQNLIVRKERLTMDCSYTDCDVEAVYYISADQRESLQFEFILPIDTPVTVTINGIRSQASVSQSYYEMPAENENAESSFPISTYKAVFSGLLEGGDNFIQVTYQQKLGIFERDYGYFAHSRFTERFTYILKPLKEWQLDPKFSMDITLATPQKRPSRDGWSIFRKRSLGCKLEGGQLTKKAGHVIYRNQLNKNFPDELICEMGDSDLLEHSLK